MKRANIRIATRDGKPSTVTGYLFDVCGLAFVVHKTGDIEPEWKVTEYTTGRAIAGVYDPTRGGAVDRFRRMLDQNECMVDQLMHQVKTLPILNVRL